METAILNTFFDLAIERKMYSKKPNLKFRLNFLFKDVNLSNKKVLDVGGGSGLLTFYAAASGAQKVVCLEPECAGSSNGMIHKFNEIKQAFNADLPVEHLPLTLQDYLQQIGNEAYDVIVLHNSINHLNEEACINFRHDAHSQHTYKAIFTEVYNKMKPGGKLVIADCSCHNFLHTIGFTRFFNSHIEWHKHQAPETWVGMLKEIGFKNPKVEWGSPNRFGKAGRVLMGNSFVSYLTLSYFKFTMDK